MPPSWCQDEDVPRGRPRPGPSHDLWSLRPSPPCQIAEDACPRPRPLARPLPRFVSRIGRSFAPPRPVNRPWAMEVDPRRPRPNPRSDHPVKPLFHLVWLCARAVHLVEYTLRLVQVVPRPVCPSRPPRPPGDYGPTNPTDTSRSSGGHLAYPALTRSRTQTAGD